MSTTTTSPAPKTSGLKYTYRDGEGYKDWYRANTGVEWDGTYLTAKPDGMSDLDWAQGMTIQQYEANAAAAGAQRDQVKENLGTLYQQQTQAAQANYNAIANQYGQQMKRDLEYAGVLHERMKKYLPQQMKAQGMGNMGIAQTAAANAAAKHIGNRGAIIGQNQASMNELTRTHSERQAALDAEYMKGMMGADETYHATMNELGNQRYKDDMSLFGQSVEEKAAEQKQYYDAGLLGIGEATTREEALALAEQMKPYITEAQYQTLVTAANNRGNQVEKIEEDELKAETDAAQDKAAGQLRDLFSAGTGSAKLKETLDSMIAAGKIPESDRAYWEGLISAVETVEQEAANDKKAADQLQEMNNAENLILNAVDAEERANQLAACLGKVSDAQYSYLERLVSVLDGNQTKADTDAAQDKAAEQLRDLFSAGTGSAKLKETLDSMIAAGKIPESDRAYWEGLISAVETVEQEAANDEKAAEQLQEMTYAENLILNAVDAEARAELLASCLGKVSDAQYSYLERLVSVLDGKQSAVDKEAGYDAANADLTTLYNAGASSSDLQDNFDSLKAAGKIEPGREQYWESMISLCKKAEEDIEKGNISKDQSEQADFAMALLGEALRPEDRADILSGLAVWLEQGTITQTQYDQAKAYCKVLDGNAEYLEKEEQKLNDEQEHELLFENVLSYIAFGAVDTDDAKAYAQKYQDKFSDAEWQSIEIQLAARSNQDLENDQIKKDEDQAKAEERFVDQMSLFASSADATKKVRDLLESYKDKLHPDVYKAWDLYVKELENSPLQKYNELLASKDEQMAFDEIYAVSKEYGSMAEYHAAVLAGNEKVGDRYQILDSEEYEFGTEQNDIVEFTVKERGYTSKDDMSIPDGFYVPLEMGLSGEITGVVRYNGKWYEAKEAGDTPALTPTWQADGKGVLDAIGDRYK